MSSSQHTRARIECVAPASLDRDLLAKWRAAAGGSASPFLLPEWTQCCGELDSRVRVGIVELERQTAFLPLELHGRSAMPVGDRYNDLQGFIASPGFPLERLTIESVLRGCGASTFRFRHWLQPTSGMQPHCWSAHPFYYIDLSEGFEAYSESRRGNKRHKLRREIGRLERRAADEFGSVDIQWVTDPEVMSQLLTWKESQAKAQGWEQSGMEKARPLLDATLGGELMSGQLAALRFGDRLVAAEYYLRSGDLLHAWIRAYDAEFAKYGPGHLLFWKSAEEAAAQGIQRIDWGSGEDAFKSKFASGTFDVSAGWADTSRLRAALRRRAADWAGKFGLRHYAGRWAARLRAVITS
ncbi:MAG: GNAT family N-acetyltransferase [Planctomycetales bacterium]|nr:GNAT family N-acetyltransferase [Planctomycetales bacterium]